MDGPEIVNSVDEIEKLDKVACRTFGLKEDSPYIGFSLNMLKPRHVRHRSSRRQRQSALICLLFGQHFFASL
jgi:hypothetical protein